MSQIFKYMDFHSWWLSNISNRERFGSIVSEDKFDYYRVWVYRIYELQKYSGSKEQVQFRVETVTPNHIGYIHDISNKYIDRYENGLYNMTYLTGKEKEEYWMFFVYPTKINEQFFGNHYSFMYGVDPKDKKPVHFHKTLYDPSTQRANRTFDAFSDKNLAIPLEGYDNFPLFKKFEGAERECLIDIVRYPYITVGAGKEKRKRRSSARNSSSSSSRTFSNDDVMVFFGREDISEMLIICIEHNKEFHYTIDYGAKFFYHKSESLLTVTQLKNLIIAKIREIMTPPPDVQHQRPLSRPRRK